MLLRMKAQIEPWRLKWSPGGSNRALEALIGFLFDVPADEVIILSSGALGGLLGGPALEAMGCDFATACAGTPAARHSTHW